MLNINAINQTIINTNYGCNLPSLAILVPGLSLYVEIMKVRTFLRTYESKFATQNPQINNHNSFEGSIESVQIDKIYKWNAIVSGILAIAFEVLFIRSSRLFAIPCALMAFQCGLAMVGYMGVMRSVTYIYSPTGASIHLGSW